MDFFQKESSAAEVSNLDSLPRETAMRRPSILKWMCLALPVGYLWFRLLDNLRLEWESNPQYSYGLLVPLLVAGLLLRRWQRGAFTTPTPPAEISKSAWLFCGLLAFLYLPTRLTEAATPEWRPLQWSLAVETIGLTFCFLYLAGGKSWLRQTFFPIGFFFIAVPWPSPIEQTIIQSLSRLNAAMVVEVLSVLDIPAIQHGNVIEVSKGLVGINDACSGIRSLQSSLMVSLFLGEFYRFIWLRRILLLPIGFGLAMLLNLCRTSLLTWLAATKGVGAIAEYHDEAGLAILMVCTTILWIAAWTLSRRPAPAGTGQTRSRSKPASSGSPGRAWRFGVALVVWLLAVELGVALWYQIRESHLRPGPNWSVKLPEQNPTFKTLPITKEENELLQFDQGRQGEWQEADGTAWQVYYYNWVPGRVAGYLAKRHTPDICMTASGYRMTSGPELMVLTVNEVVLPMRHYVFSTSGGPLQVYQCHWEAGMDQATFTADESSRFNLIRGIWAGRGNRGQKVLEVVMAGYDGPESAKAALVRQLSNLITVEH